MSAMTKLLNSLNYVGLNDAQTILSESLNEEINADQLWQAVESGKVNLCVKLKQSQLPNIGLRNTGPDSLTYCINGYDFIAELIESLRCGVRPDAIFTFHDFVLIPADSSDGGNSISMHSALPTDCEVVFATDELKSLIDLLNPQAAPKPDKDGFGKDALLRVIGALLAEAASPENGAIKQARFTEAIASKGVHGLSQRNLERAFSEANKAYAESVR